MARKPPLSVWEILEWADAHFERTGKWPNDASGRVYEYPEEKWINISKSLARGNRGLPGGSTLAQLLDEFRGVRNLANLPLLSEEQILGWADAHFLCTGNWPTFYSGVIPKTRGECWSAIDCALHMGIRGLAGGTSLVRLLREQRGVVRPHSRPQRQVAGPRRVGTTSASANGRTRAERKSSETDVAVSKPEVEPYQLDYFLILGWADAYFAGHGVWPTVNSGAIDGTVDETWSKVNTALRRGLRGLGAGSSLARLLAEKRGVRKGYLAPLNIENILRLADAHRARTGEWPTVASGRLAENKYDSWLQIHEALCDGKRGLPGGSSLAKLLDEHRGTRRALYSRPLTEETVLAWADAHFARHGRWPSKCSGAVEESPADQWINIDEALRVGFRGLSGGSSLARLLVDRRGARRRRQPPELSAEQILAWADEYYARHGDWPACRSGQVDGVPGETWTGVDMALRLGIRGLPGGSSLARLLDERRGARRAHGGRLAPTTRLLTEDAILAWADAYHARYGKWPREDSGAVDESPAENWQNITAALRMGLRGLPGGSSLAKLLFERRGVRNVRHPPNLAEEEILAWADAWFAQHGRWPTAKSGPIDAASSGETWQAVDYALRLGSRGLRGGRSLALLLSKHRSPRRSVLPRKPR